MNIFVLDENIEKCAQFHCDQHVIKMILESVQIMCTCLNKKGYHTPYKSTHKQHPCVLWVEKSYENFLWLRGLTLALNREYIYRYEKTKDHSSISVLSQIERCHFENKGLTEFVQAMPEHYKVEHDAVAAYRAFYSGEKLRFAKWTKRPVPYWIKPVRRQTLLDK